MVVSHCHLRRVCVCVCRARCRLGHGRHAMKGPGTPSIDRRGPGVMVYGFEVSREWVYGGGHGHDDLLVGHGCGDLRMGRPRGGHGFDGRGIRDHDFGGMYRSDGCGGNEVIQTRPRTYKPLRRLGEMDVFDYCRMEEARNSSHTCYDDHSPWQMRSVHGCGVNEGWDNRHTHHHHGAHLRKSVFRGRGEGAAQDSPIPNPRQSLRHRRSRLRNLRSLEEGRPHWTAWEAELFNGNG